MRVDSALVRRLHADVGERLTAAQQEARAAGRAPLTGESERQFARQIIDQVVRRYVSSQVAAGERMPPPELEEKLTRAIYARLYAAGGLQELLDDDQVEDVNVNGCDVVFVEYADGRKEPAPPVADTDEELIEQVQLLASYAGLNSRPFDSANPKLDLTLPDGSRLAAVMGVTARPAISIRRHRLDKEQLTDLVGNRTMNREAAAFIAAMVLSRMNVMISGATAVGKTTLLRAMAAQVDPAERLITIEKALELGLSRTGRHPDILELEERLPNAEGAGEVTVPELVQWTLRLDPDRVIVGEVLGEEIIAMLLAMTQGNDGSLSTIHARSALDTFERIRTYAIYGPERMPADACNRLIAAGIDFVIYLSRDATGKRRLDSIREITGVSDDGVMSTEVWKLNRDGQCVPNPDLEVQISDGRRLRLEAAGWQSTPWRRW